MELWKVFENDLQKTCLQYRKKGIALINKVETSITSYGVPKTSTVDFVGIVGPSGIGIAFDAKTTKNKTSFPFSNLKQHQEEYLRLHARMGGKSYFFIKFLEHQKDETFFMVPFEYIDNLLQTNVKSVKYENLSSEWIKKSSDFLERLKPVQ